MGIMFALFHEAMQLRWSMLCWKITHMQVCVCLTLLKGTVIRQLRRQILLAHVCLHSNNNGLKQQTMLACICALRKIPSVLWNLFAPLFILWVLRSILFDYPKEIIIIRLYPTAPNSCIWEMGESCNSTSGWVTSSQQVVTFWMLDDISLCK